MKTKAGVTIPKRRNGFYYDIPGIEPEVGYPSVTSVLKVLNKPELSYWMKKLVFEAMAKDPTLDEKVACMADFKVMKLSGADGSITHEIIDQYWKTGKYPSIQATAEKLAITTYRVDSIANYIEAFKKFVELHKPKLVESEGMIYSHKHKYAGTYDGVFEFGGHTWLLDWKTSNGIYPEYRIQLTAYKEALKELGKPVDKMGIIQLKDNGAFVFEEVQDIEDGAKLFDVFRAILYVFNWQKKLFKEDK